jgi:murein endopeptidase
MVRADRLDIDPAVWTPTHLLVIRAAAQEPRVERIFVNAAIKKALCAAPLRFYTAKSRSRTIATNTGCRICGASN